MFRYNSSFHSGHAVILNISINRIKTVRAFVGESNGKNLHILHLVDSRCKLLKYYEEHHEMDHPGTNAQYDCVLNCIRSMYRKRIFL